MFSRKFLSKLIKYSEKCDFILKLTSCKDNADFCKNYMHLKDIGHKYLEQAFKYKLEVFFLLAESVIIHEFI